MSQHKTSYVMSYMEFYVETCRMSRLSIAASLTNPYRICGNFHVQKGFIHPL